MKSEEMSILELCADILHLILDITTSWYDVLILSSTCTKLKSLHENILIALKDDQLIKSEANTKVYGMLINTKYTYPKTVYWFPASLKRDPTICRKYIKNVTTIDIDGTKYVTYMIERCFVMDFACLKILNNSVDYVEKNKYPQYVVEYNQKRCLAIVNHLLTGPVMYSSTLKIPNLRNMIYSMCNVQNA